MNGNLTIKSSEKYMTLNTVPFYFDWTFWAAIVAFIAIILSQIPPISVLLRKAKLDFELYSKISLLHKVGNPNLQLHFLITNSGGRKLKINKIEITIERDGKTINSIPAQTFFQAPTDTASILFTKFTLVPDQEWNHSINFYNDFSREDEKKFNKFTKDIKTNLQDIRDNKEEEPNKLIEAEDVFVTPFLDMFKKHFIWLSGEYKLKVKVFTDTPKYDVTKSFKFTLFEYQEEQLKELADEFKTGSGIYWYSNTPQSINLNIKEEYK